MALETSNKWWLLALPAALLCLPCALPLLAVAFLTLGGAGAIGSFLSGTGGWVTLVAGALFVLAAALIYWQWGLRRRPSPLVLIDD